METPVGPVVEIAFSVPGFGFWNERQWLRRHSHKAFWPLFSKAKNPGKRPEQNSAFGYSGDYRFDPGRAHFSGVCSFQSSVLPQEKWGVLAGGQ